MSRQQITDNENEQQTADKQEVSNVGQLAIALLEFAVRTYKSQCPVSVRQLIVEDVCILGVECLVVLKEQKFADRERLLCLFDDGLQALDGKACCHNALDSIAIWTQSSGIVEKGVAVSGSINREPQFDIAHFNRIGDNLTGDRCTIQPEQAVTDGLQRVGTEILLHQPCIGVDGILHQSQFTSEMLRCCLENVVGMCRGVLIQEVVRIQEQYSQSHYEDGGSQQRNADAKLGGELSA